MRRDARTVRREKAKTTARDRKRALWATVCCQVCIARLGLPGWHGNADLPRPTALARALADQAENC